MPSRWCPPSTWRNPCPKCYQNSTQPRGGWEEAKMASWSWCATMREWSSWRWQWMAVWVSLRDSSPTRFTRSYWTQFPRVLGLRFLTTPSPTSRYVCLRSIFVFFFFFSFFLLPTSSLLLGCWTRDSYLPSTRNRNRGCSHFPSFRSSYEYLNSLSNCWFVFLYNWSWNMWLVREY